MSRMYDSKTTTFTPEGRLLQVEYAIESINKRAPTMGLVTPEGVILGAKKQNISKLLEQEKQSEKMYALSRHLLCAATGLSSDANLLIDYARREGESHYFQFKEPIPIEQLVQLICDYKHSYTQYGSLRPMGISFLFAGYDKYNGYQLYCTDPSGNYTAWKAHVIGSNNINGISLLKEEYEESLNLEDGLKLTLKVLCKTLETTNPKPEEFELVSVSKNISGDVTIKTYCESEIKTLLEKAKLLQHAQQ